MPNTDRSKIGNIEVRHCLFSAQLVCASHAFSLPVHTLQCRERTCASENVERAVPLWTKICLREFKVCLGFLQAGNISNENAERRADMPGKPNFAEANAFDGPGPETINSRLVRGFAEQHDCCWLGPFIYMYYIHAL